MPYCSAHILIHDKQQPLDRRRCLANWGSQLYSAIIGGIRACRGISIKNRSIYGQGNGLRGNLFCWIRKANRRRTRPCNGLDLKLVPFPSGRKHIRGLYICGSTQPISKQKSLLPFIFLERFVKYAIFWLTKLKKKRFVYLSNYTYVTTEYWILLRRAARYLSCHFRYLLSVDRLGF